MVGIDLSGKTALITGGTGGIGLAAGLELGAAGANTVLTYRWGSHSEEEIGRLFKEKGAPVPLLLEADVSHEEDTRAVMAQIAEKYPGIDIFISNVGFAMKAETLNDYRKKSLYKSFDYSVWPLIDYVRCAKETFGRYPATIVGVSSNGPDNYYRGYDYVAASKALLEFFTRYMSVHLYREGCRVNAIRFGTVKTPSFTAIFGEEYFKWLKECKGVGEDSMLTPADCGKVILAVCSGLMNAMNGQIINADLGLPFQDNAMMDYITQRSGASARES
ncbi:MAG: hypothetical protein B0D92_04540 [Spirochaeta sp. LUC14_002_19_P3]|nr:MAG: hypothetical protein B0D92_04540 [Spirochaeta sp. LUC14_002_19_P3]